MLSSASEEMDRATERALTQYTVRITTEYQVDDSPVAVVGAGFGLMQAFHPDGTNYFMIASTTSILMPRENTKLAHELSRKHDGSLVRARVDEQTQHKIDPLNLARHNASAIFLPFVNLFGISWMTPEILHPSAAVPEGALVFTAAYDGEAGAMTLKYFAGTVIQSPADGASEIYKVLWSEPKPNVQGSPLVVMRRDTGRANFFAIAAPTKAESDLLNGDNAIPLSPILRALELP